MATGVPNRSFDMELHCPVCHNLCFDPVTLHCGHTFCLACLENSNTIEACDEKSCCPECGVKYQYNESQERNLELGHIVKIHRPVISNVKSQVLNDQEGETNKQVLPSCSTHDERASNTINKLEGEVADGSLLCVDVLSVDPCEHRSRLTPVMTDIQAKISLVEDLLAKAKENEITVKASNSVLKHKVRSALADMVDLIKSFSTTEMDLLVSQLKPSEDIMEANVTKLLDLHRQLKETKLQINSLLKERDDAKFNIGIQVIEALTASLVVEPQKLEQSTEMKINTDMTNMCEYMEQRNSDLRLKLGASYRQLRSLINPSEVTFDSNTLHPNLVLSEDLKTVSFSVAKQPYVAGPQRFINLFQVLSSQSFSEGDHCWILQAEGCSWVMGLCYEGLPRSGTGSGLESSSKAWCLMWFNNRIKAYDGGKETPLELRTPFLQSLEICLSFSNNSVEFYSISNVTGIKSHLYTFGVRFTEPVFLAVRMMSCQPKARISLSK